jgi:hypothetical protein
VISGGEALEEFLLAAEKFPMGLAHGKGLDVALDTLKFLLDLAAAQGFEAAFSLLPGTLLGRLKEDLEEEAAVAFVEQGAKLRGLHGLARESSDDKSGEDFFRLKTIIETLLLEALGNLATKALGFDQHADEAALGRFGSFANEFGLGLNLAAAFVGSFAESGAKHGFINAELLGDARGPLRTKQTVGNFLEIREQEIEGAQLPFSGGEIHLAGATDEVVDVRRRIFQGFDIRLGAFFADEEIGIGLFIADGGKSEDANFEILFKEERDGALGGSLAGRVGIVVDDDALGETAEQLDLRLGERGSATGDAIPARATAMASM